jgi:diguanylate cyclase (GGDEF)-like protein/PAS domain S-box-containing protein
MAGTDKPTPAGCAGDETLPRETPEAGRDFFAAVFESLDAFVLILDRAGRILQANRAVTRALGYSNDELRGREFAAALPVRDAASGLVKGLRRLEKGTGVVTFENHWATSTGERLLIAGSLTPLRDPDGALDSIVVTASDVTERRALEDELRLMSLRDDMTGLYNRRGFALLAEQRLKVSLRSGAPTSLFYADVDGLKAINDGFGHNAGDIALALCARALEATFRGSDIVARVGGDEFVVLAESDARKLTTVTSRLNDELDLQVAESGLRFPVSLTIGRSQSAPPHVLSLDELLRRADEFMYERKHKSA